MTGTLSDYDYDLPPKLIAQRPAPDRHGSRLLLLGRDTGEIADRDFRELPSLLAAGDLLVVNDTRVLAARFLGEKAETGLEAELLVHEIRAGGEALALVRPSRRFKPGDLFVAPGGLSVHIGEATGEGSRRVELVSPAGWEEAMDGAGSMPLPPYIARPADERDRSDYQTLFARRAGAVAAPTAALHFSPETLAELEAAGVRTAALTLHVGPGTFRPVREEDPSRHRMHAERYTLPAATRRAVDETRAAGGRVIAVGTTSTRALETPPADQWRSGDELIGETRLFIRPPFTFHHTDALLTNFHLPRSTLLMLVAAFAGRERILAAYAHAAAARYRFYSYGDAMLILPGELP